jgi:hypothetical protein
MKRILQISLLVSLFCIGAIAQEQIDVKSMSISVHRSGLSTSFSLVADNSRNQEVVYSYWDSSAFNFGFPNSIAMCSPCRMRGTYSTVGWGGTGFNAQLGSINTNLGARITFSGSVTSDGVSLRPSASKRKIIVRGRTNLPVARIEIVDGLGTVIAFDNNVLFDGSYILQIKPARDSNNNSIIAFDGITYNFDEPRN